MANPWYAWYPGDYDMKTKGLSDLEDLAYRRLLDAYYAGGEAIKDGRQYRMARAVTEEMRAAVDVVLGEFFFMNGDGSWHQKRADEELERRRKAFERQSEGGRRAQERHRAKLEASSKVDASTLEGGSKVDAKVAEVPTPTPTTTPSSLRSEGKSKPGASGAEKRVAEKQQREPHPFDHWGPWLTSVTAMENPWGFVNLLRKNINDDDALWSVLEECRAKFDAGEVKDPVGWLRARVKARRKELDWEIQKRGAFG